LRVELAPYLKGYKKAFHHKLKLHFHLPPARSLVRLWRKKQAFRKGKWVDISDSIYDFRYTVREINFGKRKNILGIEIGRGGFVVRGIAPIYDENNKVIGSVEVLKDFSDTLKVLKTKNTDFIVFMSTKFLEIATRVRKSPDDFPIFFKDWVMISTSFKKENVDIKSLVSPGLLKKGYTNKYISQKGKYLLSSFPIKDYANKNIGVGIIALDISKNLKIFKVIKIIIPSVFILFAIFILGYILHISKIIGNSMRKLQNQIFDVSFVLE
jgi:hypothetical protein